MGRKDDGVSERERKASKRQEKDFRAHAKKQRAKEKWGQRHSESEDTLFANQLKDQGLRFKLIDGDGNCLFRSFSDQLWGVENRHAEVRHAALDLMETEKEHYQWFIEEDEEFGAYVAEMRKDGIWGGSGLTLSVCT